MSREKVNNAGESWESLPLRWRQRSNLLAQCIITLLEKRYQQRVILGMQQTAEARVEICSLVSKEIHTTGTFHNQPWCQVTGSKLYEQKKKKISASARIDGYRTLYVATSLYFPSSGSGLDWNGLQGPKLPWQYLKGNMKSFFFLFLIFLSGFRVRLLGQDSREPCDLTASSSVFYVNFCFP